MYPHERSLVEKYLNRRFVIIGVNSDASRDLCCPGRPPIIATAAKCRKDSVGRPNLRIDFVVAYDATAMYSL